MSIANLFNAFNNARNQSTNTSTQSVVNTSADRSAAPTNETYYYTSGSPTTNTTTTSNQPASTLTDYQRSEIIRKAQAGIALDSPNAEKNALYAQYTNTASSGGSSGGGSGTTNAPRTFTMPDTSGLGQITLDEIKRKALANEKMQTPTDQKQALYDYYRNVYYGGVINQPSGTKNYDAKANGTALGGPIGAMNNAISIISNALSNPQSMTDEMKEKFNFTMADMNDPNAEWAQRYQEYADAQGQKIYENQKAALDQLVANLTNQQKSALMGITGGLEDAKSALEDKSFQNWLAARQAMANRGLAGSGIASDQDTRLLLDKQRNLAGIYRDAERQKFDVENRLGTQLEEAYRQISQLNPDATANEIFMKMFEDGKGTMLEQSKIYADLLKEAMGYDLIPAKDKYQIDQNNIMDKYKTDLNFQRDMAELGLKEREIAIAALKGDRDYSLALSEQAGYLVDKDGKALKDASGKTIPTVEKQKLDETIRNNIANNNLDQQKINETVRNNQAKEKLEQETINLRGQELVAKVTQWAEQNRLDSRKLDLNEQEFLQKIDYDNAMIDVAEARLQNDMDKTQVSALKSQLSSLDKQIAAQIKKNGKADQTLVSKRDGIIDQIAGVFSGAQVSDSPKDIQMGGGR